MNESAPLVTIYVPCRNYGRYLTQCVKSVLHQLYTNWELIIIDEASDDDTVSLAESLRQKDPSRITIIRNPEPIGLQKLANYALGLANGKYTMRLDADDWLDEGAILLMVSKIEASPDAGLVYGNYFYVNETGDVLGMERRHRLGSEDKVGHLPPHGACTLFRTRALKAAGGYSEDIDAQDGWELWYKLCNRVGAVSLDVPVFYYRQHATSLSRDNQRLLQARMRIFAQIGKSLEGDYKPTCTAVIPVRESYPGNEGVPYRMIDGSSLLERAIRSAAEVESVTQVIVSSQSQSVLDYAAGLEAQGKVPRHLRLLRDDSVTDNTKLPIWDILLHAGQYYKQLNGSSTDIMLFLSIHALNRRAEHIEKALNVLRITESDSVVSVKEERDPIFSHGPSGLKLLNPGRFQDLNYDRERLYSYNGAIIGIWWEILNQNAFLGDAISYIEMSGEDSSYNQARAGTI
jgi:glycosyltransferase involved in cell wall biosynthesis